MFLRRLEGSPEGTAKFSICLAVNIETDEGESVIFSGILEAETTTSSIPKSSSTKLILTFSRVDDILISLVLYPT